MIPDVDVWVGAQGPATDRRRPALAPIAAAPAQVPENIKAAYGAEKVALGLIPAAFKVGVALALQFGARKYGAWNWRNRSTAPIRASTYISAMQRHLDAFAAGEDLAGDSGVAHLAHLAASCAILIDAQACGHFTDDRAKEVDLARLNAEAQATIAAWPEAMQPVYG